MFFCMPSDIESQNSKIESTGVRRILLVVWLLPIGLHVLGCMVSVWLSDFDISLKPMDLAGHLLIIAYVVVGLMSVAKTTALKRLVLVGYSTFFALIGCEIGLYITAQGNDIPWFPMRKIRMAADTMPGIEGRLEFTTNNAGVRGREVDFGQTETRILCVGGSTTECLYVSDTRSWPWLLETQLTKSLNRPIFVGNAGKSGQFSLQHEYMIRHYRWTKEYDYVVILCGINDMGVSLYGSYHKKKNDVPHTTFAGRRRYNVANRLYYFRSLFLQATEAFVRQVKPEGTEFDESGGAYARRRAERQERKKSDYRTEVPAHLPDLLSQYRSDLTSLMATCREMGLQPVFMTQPVIYYENMPDHLEKLLWFPPAGAVYSPGVMAKLVDAYNQVLLEVCETEKVDVIDLAELLSRDTNTFYDDCHFNDSGCKKIAEILTGYFSNKLKN